MISRKRRRAELESFLDNWFVDTDPVKYSWNDFENRVELEIYLPGAKETYIVKFTLVNKDGKFMVFNTDNLPVISGMGLTVEYSMDDELRRVANTIGHLCMSKGPN